MKTGGFLVIRLWPNLRPRDVYRLLFGLRLALPNRIIHCLIRLETRSIIWLKNVEVTRKPLIPLQMEQSGWKQAAPPPNICCTAPCPPRRCQVREHVVVPALFRLQLSFSIHLFLRFALSLCVLWGDVFIQSGLLVLVGAGRVGGKIYFLWWILELRLWGRPNSGLLFPRLHWSRAWRWLWRQERGAPVLGSSANGYGGLIFGQIRIEKWNLTTTPPFGVAGPTQQQLLTKHMNPPQALEHARSTP